jgi:tRNA (guanine-N7-)-methyltransferase
MTIHKIIKPIKSFVLRSGRLTLRQKNALATNWEHYVLNHETEKFNWQQAINTAAPITLEIGFGMGKSLLLMAATHPQHQFIGIEVYKPGVGTLLAGLQEQQLENVRVFCADAIQILSTCIPDVTLDTVNIFFPDPWPKTRHRKRRLIQTEFINLIAQKLKTNGHLHLATDWQDYATHMMRVLSTTPHFRNIAGDGQFTTDRAERPLTKYEERGQRLGHPVWDLIFVKT